MTQIYTNKKAQNETQKKIHAHYDRISENKYFTQNKIDKAKSNLFFTFQVLKI